MTPAITVNGFHVSNPDESSSKADAVVQRELPPVLAPLAEYIYLDFDPREMFTASQEVAQGQYGSVYAAHVNAGVVNDPDSVVAVKQVPIPAGGSPKIGQLLHELSLMSQVRHKHILTTDGLFFDGVGEMLWIRMELMERSLADVLVLNEDGFQLEERVMARFASDVLLALVYLGDLDIAHRDVRSDNLLINCDGVLKLADFSNAVRVTQEGPMCADIVGVHHWQAPEMRSGPYNASKVDVWSLGATIWETAEGVPPFVDIEDPSALSDRWPPLSEAEEFTDIFHDFLRLCSEPPESRPPASQLLHNPFIQLACPRDDILQVLSLCRTIEEQIQQRENGDP
ncbi:kinase-like protein [Ramaria rubella]|nr:kinase-like protein [Ramaria rubella]